MEPTVEHRMRALLHYVPTGTTEGEGVILQEAFVQADEYAEIITPPSGSPRLLIGKKGSGKSAILKFSLDVFHQAGVPALLVKPLDLELEGMPDGASVGELTRIAYRAIVKAVAQNIGAQLGGFVTGENEVLYREAVQSGERDLDFLGKVSRLLSALSKPVAGVDLTRVLPTEDKATVVRLERAIKDNASQSSAAFYVFIDDTDQVASPGTKGHLNRIWAFLLAARELTQRVPEVRCVVTFRDEVWRELSTEKAGQRDQWDHFLRLVHYLNPTLDHIQDIFEKRLVLAAQKCGIEGQRAKYPLFFEGDRPRMPTSQKRSSWPDLIRSRSRERPRDTIHLLNMLATAAVKPPVSRITDDMFESVMPQYSSERAKLLAEEFERECPALPEILRSLATLEYKHGAFLADSEAIRKHLLTLPSAFTIKLNGKILRPDAEGWIFELWSFMYTIGIFYPRVSDSRMPKGFRFIVPADDPAFVSQARWNEMQKALWEVHPAYRDYLIEVQKDDAARFGLPSKRKKKR